jgi:hypothetical protein
MDTTNVKYDTLTCQDSMNDNDRIRELENRNSKLNSLLQNAVDRLEDNKRGNASRKNKVQGGYYMMSREAEKNIRDLQRSNATACLVFSVIREHMQIGSNAITVSNDALCRILNKSRSTIARSTKYLAKNNYVQIVKSGNLNTYVVNEQVAFAGSPNQRKAVFSATIIAHECEQEEGWEEVKKLKAVPTIYSDI